MLRLFFHGIEQTLGPALSGVAFLVYAAALGVLAVAVLFPLFSRWMEYLAMGYGLQQVWIMTCGHCGRTTRAAGRHCGYCDQALELPATLKLWSGAIRKRTSIRGQTTRWTVHLAGSLLFLFLSGWLVLSLDVVNPNGSLDRLFLGLGLLAWSAVGWFTSRAFRLAPMGSLGRMRDGAMALASIGFVSVWLFLAEEAKPVPETVIATFTAKPSAIEVENRLLQIPSGEVVFEYLQVDHEVLGYHDVIPLAFVGSNRIPISHSPVARAVIGHLRANPDEYAARGLTVRYRTDRHRVTSGSTYEVVERMGQLLIRRLHAGTEAGGAVMHALRASRGTDDGAGSLAAGRPGSGSLLTSRRGRSGSSTGRFGDPWGRARALS